MAKLASVVHGDEPPVLQVVLVPRDKGPWSVGRVTLDIGTPAAVRRMVKNLRRLADSIEAMGAPPRVRGPKLRRRK